MVVCSYGQFWVSAETLGASWSLVEKCERRMNTLRGLGRSCHSWLRVSVDRTFHENLSATSRRKILGTVLPYLAFFSKVCTCDIATRGHSCIALAPLLNTLRFSRDKSRLSLVAPIRTGRRPSISVHPVRAVYCMREEGVSTLDTPHAISAFAILVVHRPLTAFTNMNTRFTRIFIYVFYNKLYYPGDYSVRSTPGIVAMWRRSRSRSARPRTSARPAVVNRASPLPSTKKPTTLSSLPPQVNS